MGWKATLAAFLVAFLVAASASAETIKDSTSTFSIDVDTTSACIIVPAARRTETFCEGVDTAVAAQLPKMDGKDAHWVFLGSLELPTSGRYWFGVIRLVPEGGVDRDGLTTDALANMKRALRNVVAKDGAFRVSDPGVSEIRTVNDIDSVAVAYDAWPSADPTSRFASTFALYFGADDYVIYTFTDAEHETAVAELMHTTLATTRLQERASWSKIEEAKALAYIPSIVVTVLLFVLAVFVVRDVRKLQIEKPKRDPMMTHLTLYESAHMFGLLTVVGWLASAALHGMSHALDSRDASTVLDGLGGLVGLATIAPLLLWVNRVAANARALGCATMDPSMAVVWLLVPAAFVYMPFKALSEIAAAARSRRKRTRTIWLVAFWWLSFMTTVASRLVKVPAVHNFALLATAITGYAMVVALDADHEKLRRRLAKAGEVASTK